MERDLRERRAERDGGGEAYGSPIVYRVQDMGEDSMDTQPIRYSESFVVDGSGTLFD